MNSLVLKNQCHFINYYILFLAEIEGFVRLVGHFGIFGQLDNFFIIPRAVNEPIMQF